MKNEVASTSEFRFRDDMHNAPMGETIMLINEGGCFCRGVLNEKNKHTFIEWQYVPKRALKRKDK